MKKLFFVLIVAAAFASCKKDNPAAPAAKATFMSKWTWVYGAGGIYNASESYTLDANNKLSSSIYNRNEGTTILISSTYTRNAAGQVIKEQSDKASAAQYSNFLGNSA